MTKAKNLTEVRQAAERLFELKQKQAELERLIKESEDSIKGYLDSKGEDEVIVGTVSIKYKPIIQNKLNTKAFKTSYPDLYNSLCEQNTYYRLYVKPY